MGRAPWVPVVYLQLDSGYKFILLEGIQDDVYMS